MTCQSSRGNRSLRDTLGTTNRLTERMVRGHLLEWCDSLFKNCVAGSFQKSNDVIHLVGRDADFSQRILEVLKELVEVDLAKSHFSGLFMCSVHTPAGVHHSSTQQHGYKHALSRTQTVHIGTLEKGTKDRVGEYLLIEQIDCGLDFESSSNCSIESFSHRDSFSLSLANESQPIGMETVLTDILRHTTMRVNAPNTMEL